MGERDFDLFTLFVYFTQLLPCGGAEMTGHQTGLYGRETKLV